MSDGSSGFNTPSVHRFRVDPSWVPLIPIVWKKRVRIVELR